MIKAPSVLRKVIPYVVFFGLAYFVIKTPTKAANMLSTVLGFGVDAIESFGTFLAGLSF